MRQTAEQQLPIKAAASVLTRTPATITVLVIIVSISLAQAGRSRRRTEGSQEGKEEATNSYLANGRNTIGQRGAGNTFTFIFFQHRAITMEGTSGNSRGRSDDCRSLRLEHSASQQAQQLELSPSNQQSFVISMYLLIYLYHELPTEGGRA